MSIAPPDVTDFTDYILDNYISEDSQFPPFIWAEEPQTYPRTTNGPESFHSNNNQQFYKQHPNHQNVINVLIEIQTETNSKINSIGRKITNKFKEETVEKHKFVQQCWETYEVEKNILNYIKKLGPRFAGKK